MNNYYHAQCSTFCWKILSSSAIVGHLGNYTLGIDISIPQIYEYLNDFACTSFGREQQSVYTITKKKKKPKKLANNNEKADEKYFVDNFFFYESSGIKAL
jgi:hypothetical protein